MGLNHLTIDFETRSEANLKDVGAWKYSRHPSTIVLCLSFRDEKTSGLWAPFIESSVPVTLLELLEKYHFIEAHNTFFELCIWENVLTRLYPDFPTIDRSRWQCSAAKASALSLPRTLEQVAEALNLPMRKDMTGNRIMKKVSRPRKPTKNDPSIWHEDPTDLNIVYNYCKTDTATEVLASEKMPDLSKDEKVIFELDKVINLRGIPIDRKCIEIALDFIERYSVGLVEELGEITDGEVQTAGQIAKMKTWLAKQGVELEGLSADIVEKAIGETSGVAKRVLEIRKALGKSSTKKFKKFLDMSDDDDRVRGTLLYHGASTGRFSGRGIQIQNFPSKGLIKDVDECIETLGDGDYELFEMFYPDVMKALSSCLRGMVKAPKGKKFYNADFSSIESRILFWLSGEEKGLEIYKTHGLVYEDMAAYIYQKPLKQIKNPSPERSLGKAVILACGYGMSHKKFYDTMIDWKVPNATKELAVIGVTGFREKYSGVVGFWYAIGNAAIKAVKNPGIVASVGLVSFKKTNNYLFMKLPNGRKLAYYDPFVEQKELSFGVRDQLCYMGVNSQTRKWEKQRTYGAKLVENCCQAVSRDFMTDAMLRIEKKGYNIILTVHDEIMVEVDEDFGSLEEFVELMKVVPKWGEGCPINAEGWEGKRFKK